MTYNILYNIYRTGPLVFGFWGGKSDSEICSILTNVNEELWNNNMNTCHTLIQKHYNSFAIVVQFIIICYIISKVISLILLYVFIIRPLKGCIVYEGNCKKLK